jgi:ATP-dependent exoDNAse (exonuclease V) beta subunit
MLDFDDLIDLTARLIRDNRQVRRSVGSNIDQMLIDECQDTDATQLQMLWGLLSDEAASESLPESSKICIIGDLKQSIYRFRGAQAEVFEKLCSRFGDNRVLLDKSFRTHRAGAAFVNETFSQLMSGYEPIASSRTELPDCPAVEILLAQCDDGANAEAAADAQAELVAQRISEIIDGREEIVFDRAANKWRPARPGDFAVLFARMTTSLRYEYALQRRNLPYYVVGGTGFFSRQEVYDVLNALRVIDNTFDDIALFGLLRSAMFGADDNVLLHIASTVEPPYFDQLTDGTVLDGIPEPQARQLRFAHELLVSLHREKDALGPAAIIERVLEQTGYQAVLLSQFHGRRKLGNVLQLLDAARSSQATGKISLADFIRRYDEYVTDQSRYEQASVADETDDVIRIMTVHKAKGLEFPIVIIPDLNVGSHQMKDRILFHPDWSVTCKPPGIMDEDERPDKSKDEEPVSFSLAKEAEKQSAHEEDVRRFYVAATRHQDHLILVGADRRKKEGQFKDKGSCLAMLDDVFGIADAIDAEAEAIEYGGGFAIRLARVEPARPTGGKRKTPSVLQIISAGGDAGQVAEALASIEKNAEAENLNLIGPLRDAAGGETVAATALADFDHCPMLYRWRHELRVPRTTGVSSLGDVSPVKEENMGETPMLRSRLDAATAGTFFHRCMELVDFDDIASVQTKSLAGRVAAEMELTVPTESLADELSEMLERLSETPLMKQLAEAQQRLAELSFVYRAGNMDITGQIDLLYQDAEGLWHVVDYKSDRIAPEQAAEHAGRYELQMTTYLAAAGKAFDTEIADATVYFLRAGVSHCFGATPESIAAAELRLSNLAAELIRCRRAGQFPRISDNSLCKSCPYANLCVR